MHLEEVGSFTCATATFQLTVHTSKMGVGHKGSLISGLRVLKAAMLSKIGEDPLMGVSDSNMVGALIDGMAKASIHQSFPVTPMVAEQVVPGLKIDARVRKAAGMSQLAP